MLELLTGTGLAISAGLNAYIPLLALGLAGRFTDLVALPSAWSWLENPWVLAILGVLLVIEFFADKIPLVDNVNDWLQTVVRPAAGGIVFGSGATATTTAVTSPEAFFSNNQWVTIVLGVVIALAIHVAKSAARPIVNIATVGVATPVVSTAEDIGSVSVSILAILIPLIIIVVIPLVIWIVWMIIRYRRKRNGRPPKGPTVPDSAVNRG